MTDLDNIITIKSAFEHVWKELLESDKLISTILYVKDGMLIRKDIDKNDVDISVLNYNIFIDNPKQIYEIRSVIGKHITDSIDSSTSETKKNAFKSYQEMFFDHDDYVYYDFNQEIFFWYRRHYSKDFCMLIDDVIEHLWHHVNIDEMLHAVKLNYKTKLLYNGR